MRSHPVLVPMRPSGDNSNAPATTSYVNAAVATAVSSAISGITIFSSVEQGLVPPSGGGTTNFLRADATFAAPPNTSAILQVQQATYTTASNLTDTIPADDTVPLVTEGTEILSLAMTPSSSNSRILATIHAWGTIDNTAQTVSATAALFRDTTCINAAMMGIWSTTGEDRAQISGSLTFLDSPATTSPTTYSVRVGPNSSGTALAMNGIISNRRYGGASACTLTLMEVA